MIAHRDLYQRGCILHIELGQHILVVRIDSSAVQEELRGDLMVREAGATDFHGHATHHRGA
jgi:hypothetical protein